MTKQILRKSRPMHFRIGFSDETLCGKSSARCRSAMKLSVWDDLRLADGRRCEACRPGVEAIRAKEGA